MTRYHYVLLKSNQLIHNLTQGTISAFFKLVLYSSYTSLVFYVHVFGTVWRDDH